MIVLGFYKYVEIEWPEALCTSLRGFCERTRIRGTILISHEGINASVSGTRNGIDEFRQMMTADPRFQDLFYKEEDTLEAHPFKKLKVKVKREIIRFDQEVDVRNTGRHLSATEFLDLYDAGGNLKENVVLLDTRNTFEYERGKFRGATHLGLRSFSEFARKIDVDALRDKQVVMYCTGGVRCEKATAYVIERGVTDVAQLNQGIIQFGKECPDTVWEGACVVFDNRMVSPMNQADDTESRCAVCNAACDFQRYCRNADCGRLYVCCFACEERMDKCCSMPCRQEEKIRRTPSHLVHADATNHPR